MGRNDFSIMDFIFKFKDLKFKFKSLFIALFIGLFAVTAAFAQNKTAQPGEGATDELKFVIKPKYQVNILHFGRFTDYSKVKRVYDDNSEFDYERGVTYYYTLRQPAASEDGFTTLKVSIDSLVYEFKSDKRNMKFNSMWDEVPPLNIPDYLTVAIPQSKTFEMTYSPYGEVVKIEGPRIEDFREEISTLEDTLQKFYYVRYSDDDILSNIVDFQRGSIPGFPVDEDTSWTSNVRFILDGITVNGRAKGALTDQANGRYYMLVTADSLEVEPQKAYKYGITKALANITGGNASVEYKMESAPGGLLNLAQAKLYGEFEGSIKKTKFKEYIETSQVWEIVESYRW